MGTCPSRQPSNKLGSGQRRNGFYEHMDRVCDGFCYDTNIAHLPGHTKAQTKENPLTKGYSIDKVQLPQVVNCPSSTSVGITLLNPNTYPHKPVSYFFQAPSHETATPRFALTTQGPRIANTKVNHISFRVRGRPCDAASISAPTDRILCQFYYSFCICPSPPPKFALTPSTPTTHLPHLITLAPSLRCFLFDLTPLSISHCYPILPP